MPNKNNNDNVLRLASSNDKEKEYKLKIIYKDNNIAAEEYACNFFGVSIEHPNFFLIGRENKDDFTPIALIDVDFIRKIDIREE